MSSLYANSAELRSAFFGFKQHAPDAKHSRFACLDAFYAVECGLKALILIQHKSNISKELRDKLITHNLYELAKMCNPNITLNLYGSVKLKSRGDTPEKVPLDKLHQVLRYGIKIEDSEWKKHAMVLDDLYETLKKRLNRWS